MLFPHIFRAYDIRGVYEQDFDEIGAELIGRAYGTYLHGLYPQGELQIFLGRDGRISGELLQQAFLRGILSTGVAVMELGAVPSPLLYFAICEGDFSGGVMITASHNPKQYNGFKLQKKAAHAIGGAEIQAIWQILERQDFLVASEPGKVSSADVTEKYFAKVQSLAKFHSQNKKPKIVIDAGNGIMGTFAPKFFQQIGCEVIELYCTVDGNFPNHDADPERAENLVELKKLVQTEQADFGLAFDGDGDRVGIVDDRGQHYSADLLLLVLARDLLSRKAGAAIVYDLKSTQVLAQEILKHGGKPLLCKTGHSFVEELMQESEALLGGEVSGHLFFAEDYYGFDDALVAAYKLLTIFWNSGKPIAQHFTDLPRTYITPELKVQISEAQKFPIMERIVRHFLALYPDALTIDGIRIDFDTGSWGIIRPSNTSPYLTMRFEAGSAEQLQEIQQIVFEHLRTYPEISAIPEIFIPPYAA